MKKNSLKDFQVRNLELTNIEKQQIKGGEDGGIWIPVSGRSESKDGVWFPIAG